MAKEALLIVDMSNDFVADNGTLTVGKPAQAIVSYIKETAQAFLDNGQVVVVSMDDHEENHLCFVCRCSSSAVCGGIELSYIRA